MTHSESHDAGTESHSIYMREAANLVPPPGDISLRRALVALLKLDFSLGFMISGFFLGIRDFEATGNTAPHPTPPICTPPNHLHSSTRSTPPHPHCTTNYSRAFYSPLQHQRIMSADPAVSKAAEANSKVVSTMRATILEATPGCRLQRQHEALSETGPAPPFCSPAQ